MRGLRQFTMPRAPQLRGKDLSKKSPVRVGIDATSSENSGAWTSRPNVVVPGWARKYRKGIDAVGS